MHLPRPAILIATALGLLMASDLGGCRRAGPRLECTHERLGEGFIEKVLGFGDNDVWVTASAGAIGLVYHWDGRAWSEYLRTTMTINDIWGASPRDLWVVGKKSSFQHWNGTSWSAVAVPAGNQYRAIWGSSASDVWAVGYDGAIVRWNGITWSTVESGTKENLFSVHGTSANDVWIGGFGLLHWNGKTLEKHSVPGSDKSGIVGVWASSPSDAWGVARGRIVHWNGSAWRQLTDDDVDLVTKRWVACCPTKSTPSFQDLSAQGPNEVWAVGDEHEQGAGSARESAVFRWDGKRWERYGVDAETDFSGVWSAGPGKLWIASGDHSVLRCSVR